MVRSKLCAHTCTTHRRPVPDRGPSGQDGRIKQRRELRYRRSLIYKLPILGMLGASARYSCFCTPVETSTPPRRRKVHSAQDALPGILYSIPLRLLSAQKPLRWVFERFGDGEQLRSNKKQPSLPLKPAGAGFCVGGAAALPQGTGMGLAFSGVAGGGNRRPRGNKLKIRPCRARDTPHQRCPR